MAEREPKFAASLMCMDYLHAGEQLEVINRRAQFYHVDVMDGHYAPNLAMSPDLFRSLKPAMALPSDVHLMTMDPNHWIGPFLDAGAEYISLHAETINANAFRTLNRIRDGGCREGIILNPATPLSFIEMYIDRLDLLTIMTVDIGFAGQPFIDAMLRKIEAARELRERHGYKYLIQIDGCCNETTYRKLWNAGADIFIIASTLFNREPDLDQAFDRVFSAFRAQTGR